jgi:hypothetical protein
MNTLFKSVVFAGAVLFSQASFALYFDAGLGSSDVDGRVTIPGLGTVEGDDSDTYIRLGVGDKINKNLNWEAGYWDLGTDFDVNGFFGNIKAATDLNRDTQLFGKVGLYMWDADGDNDGIDLFFGGGVTFKKVGPGNINLEILMGDLDESDFTTIGASYSIPFN